MASIIDHQQTKGIVSPFSNRFKQKEYSDAFRAPIAAPLRFVWTNLTRPVPKDRILWYPRC
jgi:hypothetical protein